LGVSIPNCFAYSAFSRCQPPNFRTSAPTIRPIGSPARNRSRTSKQMCQPVAPHEMKRRAMLCHSVRRVPPDSVEESRESFQRLALVDHVTLLIPWHEPDLACGSGDRDCQISKIFYLLVILSSPRFHSESMIIGAVLFPNLAVASLCIG
jgi:hypothetical protein